MIPDKQVLTDLYIEKKLTDKQIGNQLNISAFTVWRLRKEFGIKGIYHDQRERLISPEVQLSARQYEIIMGSLLGDCCIKKTDSASAAVSISHSEKQLEYIMWIYGQLKTICPNPPRPEIHHKKYLMYALRTKARLDIKDIYRKVYLPKKTITPWLCEQMSALSIAVWFMDDGNAEFINENKTVFSFATNSFSYNEVYLLSKMMYDKFGIRCSLNPVKRPNGEEQTVLHISQESSYDFEKLVKPFIPSCMLYKMPGELRERYLVNNAEKRIGKETFVNMYCNEKLTQRQISECLGIHRTTVAKYMKLYKIVRRNSSKAQQSGKNSRVKRDTSGMFTSVIATEDIETKAKEILLSMRSIGFPYLEIPSEEKCFSFIDALSLKNSEMCEFKKSYKYSPAGMRIISPFFPGIFSMATDKSLSPFDIFNNDQMFLDCIERTLIYARNDSVPSIRQGLKTYRGNRSVSVFPPMWAKTIIEIVTKRIPNKIKVLDFSAGFGGRLVGSYASGLVNEYVGIDPLKGNIKGLLSLTNIIEEHSKLANKEFSSRIIEDMAETALPKLEGNFDLVLTSPPYWNKERYSSDITQCYNRYTSYSSWESEWLNRIIKMSCSLLKPGGTIAIFASDCKNGPVGTSVKMAIENELGVGSAQIHFLLPNLEYHRTKGLVRKEIAWIGTKPS